MSDTNEQSAAEFMSMVPPSNRNYDRAGELKKQLDDPRLPAELKAQILAELPSPQERERLFWELQENGGLSSEQFFTSLGLEVEPPS
jgi:hypothetical protein